MAFKLLKKRTINILNIVTILWVNSIISFKKLSLECKLKRFKGCKVNVMIRSETCASRKVLQNFVATRRILVKVCECAIKRKTYHLILTMISGPS